MPFFRLKFINPSSLAKILTYHSRVVKTLAFHARGPGSFPALGDNFFRFILRGFFFTYLGFEKNPFTRYVASFEFRHRYFEVFTGKLFPSSTSWKALKVQLIHSFHRKHEVHNVRLESRLESNYFYTVLAEMKSKIQNSNKKGDNSWFLQENAIDIIESISFDRKLPRYNTSQVERSQLISLHSFTATLCTYRYFSVKQLKLY